MDIRKNTRYFAQLLENAIAASSQFTTQIVIPNKHNAPKALLLIQSFLSRLKNNSLNDTTDTDTVQQIMNSFPAIHAFFTKAFNLIEAELVTMDSKKMKNALQQLQNTPHKTRDIYKAMWELFSPEAFAFASQDFSKEQFIQSLRKERRVKLESENKHTIQNPAKEILFTSNALFSIPKKESIDKLKLSDFIKEKLHTICEEEQKYWYDHPMPIGINKEANELLYGLQGLAETFQKEKELGNVAADARLSVVISVSLTHEGLESIILEYLHEDIHRHARFEYLDVYIFTEHKTKKIVQALAPLLGEHTKKVEMVFGVNGRYGRHYSFLKAIAAIWHVCKDNNIKGTFKIDLDQIFPQDAILQNSGISAFSHFTTALWGAEATDSYGKKVYLGMLAGGLVNEADIHKNLFNPDVSYPKEPLEADNLFFPRQLMMALSTRSEIMMKYPIDKINEQSDYIHRIHVTGGTNGILVNALRTYRPFTPTCIGRAEDQAYILSVYNNSEPYLRYAHASGLIMRHDKTAFAGESIQSAKMGTFSGDLLRIFLFSQYASVLPGGIDEVKKQCAPFTSIYVSNHPMCLIIARLLFQVFSLLEKGENEQALQQIEITAQTFDTDIRKTKAQFEQEIQYEREAWNCFYDTLDELEKEKNNTSIHQEIINIIEDCKL